MHPNAENTLPEHANDTTNNNSSNNDDNDAQSPLNVSIKDLTLQFETSAITTPLDHHTNSHPYAHRQNVLNAFRPPVTDRTPNDTQSLRISKALAWQRTNRNKQTEKARQIALGEIDSSEDEDNEDDGNAAQNGQPKEPRGSKRSRDEDTIMEDRKYRCLQLSPKPKNHSNKKPYSKFANQVMYAETMESLPPDLVTDWVMMICPVGKRCLVTSGNGQTVARARSGRIINRFQSNLPNGSINRGQGASSNYCILDCIYDATSWTFYVLDLMCWNGYAIYDCDTEFRHFWLQTKLWDSDLNLYSKSRNQGLHHFKPLIPVPTSEAKQVAADPKTYLSIHQPSLSYDVDGLLFYHRKTQYVTGATPLVCWLPSDRLDVLSS